MSIARQFLREFRPLFRMLEEPFGRNAGFVGMPAARTMFEDPFFQAPTQARPAVDLSEESNQYVVEAELPGVKKEDIDVRIGEGGRSVTIEGRIVQKSVAPPEQGTTTADKSAGAEVAQTDKTSNQLAVERAFTGSTTFTRTVWLPRPVDAKNVSAKLADGILTLNIPKAEDVGSVKINVD